MANVEMEPLSESRCEWKTPIRKLAKFFQISRDKWKAKYAQQVKKNKLLSNHVRAVEVSRDHWRQVAEKAKQESRRLREELAREKKCPAHA